MLKDARGNLKTCRNRDDKQLVGVNDVNRPFVDNRFPEVEVVTGVSGKLPNLIFVRLAILFQLGSPYAK